MWRTPVCVHTPDAEPGPGRGATTAPVHPFPFYLPVKEENEHFVSLQATLTDILICSLPELAWGREGSGLFNVWAAGGNSEEGLGELQSLREAPGESKDTLGFLNSSSNRSLRVAGSSPGPRLCQWFKSLFPAGLMMANQIYLYKLWLWQMIRQTIVIRNIYYTLWKLKLLWWYKIG